MGLALGRLLRNATCSLGVLAVIGGIAFGLPALNRAMPGIRPVALDRPYPLGGGFTVVPPAGALLDLTETRHGVDRGGAVFLLGPVRYALTVAPHRGDLADAVGRLRTKLRERKRYRTTDEVWEVSTVTGLPGRWGEIRPAAAPAAPAAAGPAGVPAPGGPAATLVAPIGRYAVYLAGQLLVEVVVTGPADELPEWLTPIEASLASIRAPS